MSCIVCYLKVVANQLNLVLEILIRLQWARDELLVSMVAVWRPYFSNYLISLKYEIRSYFLLWLLSMQQILSIFFPKLCKMNKIMKRFKKMIGRFKISSKKLITRCKKKLIKKAIIVLSDPIKFWIDLEIIESSFYYNSIRKWNLMMRLIKFSNRQKNKCFQSIALKQF